MSKSPAPVILVCGPADHGKSTFRRKIAEILKTPSSSCSDVILFLMQMLTDIPMDVLIGTRKERRADLVALGDWMTSTDAVFPDEFQERITDKGWERVREFELGGNQRPSGLLRMLYLGGVRVMDGARRKEELREFLSVMDWLGVTVFLVWVENPSKGRIEGDNLDFSPADFPDAGFHHLDSSGSPDEAEAKVLELLADLGWSAPSAPPEGDKGE